MNKIIMFHDVRDSVWIENTLLLLKRQYSLVSIQELEDYYYNKKAIKNICHITVDDGDKTFYDFIYPVLKKHNIPATIFVSPRILQNSTNFWFQEMFDYDSDKFKKIIADYFNIKTEVLIPYSLWIILKNEKIEDIQNVINKYREQFRTDAKESQNISIEQLKEIDKHGLVTIGGHTLTHPILANEIDSVSENEILLSMSQLKDILGHEIKYFAYPNGIPDLDFNLREINTLNQINCRLAFSTETKNFDLNDNPLSIPRFGISYGNQYFIRTKLFLGKYWDMIKNVKSMGEKKARIKLGKLSIIK